jgi:DNA-binding transcriptional LysR family regulator
VRSGGLKSLSKAFFSPNTREGCALAHPCQKSLDLLTERWRASIVRDFLKGHPKVRIEVITQSGPVFDQEADVVVTSVRPKVPGLTGETISKVMDVVCTTPKYLKTHGKPKTVGELAQHDCLTDSATASKTSTAAGSAMWRFRNGHRFELVEVKGSFCSDSAAMLRQIALDHVGIGMCDRGLSTAPDHGGVLDRERRAASFQDPQGGRGDRRRGFAGDLDG